MGLSTAVHTSHDDEGMRMGTFISLGIDLGVLLARNPHFGPKNTISNLDMPVCTLSGYIRGQVYHANVVVF